MMMTILRILREDIGLLVNSVQLRFDRSLKNGDRKRLDGRKPKLVVH